MRTLAAALYLLPFGLGVSQAQTTSQNELFGKNARPLFASKCQGCHNAKLKSGGLDLSSVEGFTKPASTGIFGKPSEAEKSVLARALSFAKYTFAGAVLAEFLPSEVSDVGGVVTEVTVN